MKAVAKAILIAVAIPLAACTPTPSDVEPETSVQAPQRPSQGRAVELTENVQRIARSGQDLSDVRLFSDGCYWWLYEGIVEDTYIPLETRDGRMICARGQGISIEEFEAGEV